MSNLAVVLEWKFPGEGGIETKEGRLSAWPSKLGAFPDDATIAQWTGEYDAQQKELDQKKAEAAKQGVAMDMATGDYIAVLNESASGFDISAFNAAGSRVARNFDYMAKGYGEVAA